MSGPVVYLIDDCTSTDELGVMILPYLNSHVKCLNQKNSRVVSAAETFSVYTVEKLTGVREIGHQQTNPFPKASAYPDDDFFEYTSSVQSASKYPSFRFSSCTFYTSLCEPFIDALQSTFLTQLLLA